MNLPSDSVTHFCFAWSGAAKEEARKLKELEKMKMAEERELKRLEAAREKERKAEERRKAVEERKKYVGQSCGDRVGLRGLGGEIN